MTLEHTELLLRILNEWRKYVKLRDKVRAGSKKANIIWERNYALRRVKLEWEKCNHEGITKKEVLELLREGAEIIFR